MQSRHHSTRPTLKARPAPVAPDNVEPDPAIRRASNLAILREMTDLGMQMARAAAAEVLDPQPAEPAAPRAAANRPTAARPAPRPRFRSPDPHLAFARATRAVRQAIALETRILDGTLARPVRYTPSDPNQVLLRKTLLGIARKEPNPAARTQLCRHVNESLDTEFRDHPDARIEETLIAVANQLGLHLDFKDLPDELIGMPPRSVMPDPNHPLRR